MRENGEKRQFACGSGKWSQSGVPHRGWTCTGIHDLGSPNAICDMCETQAIRYVHYMDHPDYPDQLGVGCVCAGHMEHDYEAARHREQSMKNAAHRRSIWLRRTWRTSAKGNPYLNTDGYNIVLYQKHQRWSGIITNRTTGEKLNVRRLYSTLDQAKLAVFDRLIFLKEGT